MNNIQNNLKNLYRDQIEKSQQTTLENSVEFLFEKGKRAEIGEIRVYGGVQYVKHAEGWVYAKKDGSHGIERPGGKRETAGEHHITHHKEHTSKKGGGSKEEVENPYRLPESEKSSHIGTYEGGEVEILKRSEKLSDFKGVQGHEILEEEGYSNNDGTDYVLVRDEDGDEFVTYVGEGGVTNRYTNNLRPKEELTPKTANSKKEESIPKGYSPHDFSWSSKRGGKQVELSLNGKKYVGLITDSQIIEKVLDKWSDAERADGELVKKMVGQLKEV